MIHPFALYGSIHLYIFGPKCLCCPDLLQKGCKTNKRVTIISVVVLLLTLLYEALTLPPFTWGSESLCLNLVHKNYKFMAPP